MFAPITQILLNLVNTKKQKSREKKWSINLKQCRQQLKERLNSIGELCKHIKCQCYKFIGPLHGKDNRLYLQKSFFPREGAHEMRLFAHFNRAISRISAYLDQMYAIC